MKQFTFLFQTADLNISYDQVQAVTLDVAWVLWRADPDNAKRSVFGVVEGPFKSVFWEC